MMLWGMKKVLSAGLFKKKRSWEVTRSARLYSCVTPYFGIFWTFFLNYIEFLVWRIRNVFILKSDKGHQSVSEHAFKCEFIITKTHP